jgi:hypothetical protein
VLSCCLDGLQAYHELLHTEWLVSIRHHWLAGLHHLWLIYLHGFWSFRFHHLQQADLHHRSFGLWPAGWLNIVVSVLGPLG